MIKLESSQAVGGVDSGLGITSIVIAVKRYILACACLQATAISW